MPNQSDHLSVSPLATRPKLRCLGGIVAADGRRVRARRFLRAPALTDMTADETAWLIRLNPAAIVDFRDAEEAARDVVALPPDLAARRVPLAIAASAGPRIRTVMENEQASPADFVEVMIDIYRILIRTHADIFRSFLQVVASADERPVLFHCAAGKDRTGVAAALLLTALGTPRAAVMQDYLATATLWQPDETQILRVPEPARAAIFGVDTRYLDAAFAELDDCAGGVERFVQVALGGEAASREFRARHLI